MFVFYRISMGSRPNNTGYYHVCVLQNIHVVQAYQHWILSCLCSTEYPCSPGLSTLDIIMFMFYRISMGSRPINTGYYRVYVLQNIHGVQAYQHWILSCLCSTEYPWGPGLTTLDIIMFMFYRISMGSRPINTGYYHVYVLQNIHGVQAYQHWILSCLCSTEYPWGPGLSTLDIIMFKVDRSSMGSLV